MRGPAARLIEAAFYENFVAAGGVVVTPELDEGAPGSPTGGESIIVRSSPTGGSNDLKRLYLYMLALARRTLDITTPYFLTDESTTWALQDAVSRGVRVRILTEGDVTDAKSVKYASRSAYDALMSIGIEMYEYQPTMMHTKVMVVDGVWAMFGSANFDNRSLELNDELNVAVSSPDLAAPRSIAYLETEHEHQMEGWLVMSRVPGQSLWSAMLACRIALRDGRGAGGQRAPRAEVRRVQRSERPL